MGSDPDILDLTLKIKIWLPIFTAPVLRVTKRYVTSLYNKNSWKRWVLKKQAVLAQGCTHENR